MKFVKGMLIGTALATGLVMMYNGGIMDKNKMMKKGKQFARKMGII